MTNYISCYRRIESQDGHGLAFEEAWINKWGIETKHRNYLISPFGDHYYTDFSNNIWRDFRNEYLRGYKPQRHD